MSFLPYDSGTLGGWFSAMGTSVLLHGGTLVALLNGTTLFQEKAPEVKRPSFNVTIERLDSDTLAGIVERKGAAGAPDAPDSDAVEPSPATDPDSTTEIATVAPDEVLPETVEPADDLAETTEFLAPETIIAKSVEPLAAVEPDMISADTVETATGTPVSMDSGPLIAETVMALRPQSSTVQAIRPIAPSGQSLTAFTPVPANRQIVTALKARPQTAQPQPVARAPAPPASAQDLAVGDLIRKIRSASPNRCLIALPRRDGKDGVGLALVSSTDSAMSELVNAVLTEEDAAIRQTRTLVDPRQCPALTYVRRNQDYPAPRLGLRIDAPEVASGGRLTGVLRGTAGRYVTLLLVDNNGVVQDLQRFLSFSGNFARFDVPVTRVGIRRDTSQLLLAIATRRPTLAIRNRAGQLAQDVFADLNGEIAESAALAVSTFDVR